MLTMFNYAAKELNERSDISRFSQSSSVQPTRSKIPSFPGDFHLEIVRYSEVRSHDKGLIKYAGISPPLSSFLRPCSLTTILQCGRSGNKQSAPSLLPTSLPSSPRNPPPKETSTPEAATLPLKAQNVQKPVTRQTGSLGFLATANRVNFPSEP